MPKKLTIIPITSPDAQPEQPDQEQAPEQAPTQPEQAPTQPEQTQEITQEITQEQPPSLKAEPQNENENEDINTEEMELYLKSEGKRRKAEKKLTEEKAVCPDCNKTMSNKSFKYSHAKNFKAKQPPPPTPEPEPPKTEPKVEVVPKPKRKANPKPKAVKESIETDTEAQPIQRQKVFYEVKPPNPHEREQKKLTDRRERDLERLNSLKSLMANAF